jgi:hypothetical protein
VGQLRIQHQRWPRLVTTGRNFTLRNNKADATGGVSFKYFATATSIANCYLIRNNITNNIATACTALNANINNFAGGSHATVDGN